MADKKPEVAEEEAQPAEEAAPVAIIAADAVEQDKDAPAIVGNPDNWQLLTKFVSSDERIIKSTKAWHIEGLGCLVQTYSKIGNAISDTSCFIAGTYVVDDNDVPPGASPGKKLAWNINV